MKTAIGLCLSLVITGSVFAQGISVNFDGAKVVYIDESNILRKIDNQGNVSSVLNTNVAVSRIHFSEQGNLFVVFQSRQRFDDGYDYLLARAVPTNNTISGIDTNLSSIVWDSSGLNPGVQSDSLGNLYYLTYPLIGDGIALRKSVNANGTNIVNLVSGNIWINHWLVRSDGIILMGGYTLSTGVYWLRKLTPDNNLSSLAINAYVRFLLDFPDDRVYTGIYYSDLYYSGVYRLPVSLSSFDVYTPYIGQTFDTYTPEYSVSSITDGHNSTYVKGFGDYSGTFIRKYIKTDSARTIVLAGLGSYRKTVVQYYPAPPEIIEPTLIDSPTLIEKISHLLLIAGTKNGVNKLILYDPATSNEISLLNEDIEIYHLTSLYDGYVWLDGLKFNGNQYVVGKIQIIINPALRGTVKSVGQFQEMTTLSGKPVDLVGIIANPIQAPTGITASDGTYSNLVRVTWTASAGATSYQIWRYTNSYAGLSSQIGTSSTTSYDDTTTAAAGTLYYYWVKATDGSNVSAFSSFDTGYSGSTNPSPGPDPSPGLPVRPAIKANGTTGNIVLNYSAPVSVTVELDAGDYRGVNVDWWVVALAQYQGLTEWYYLNSAMEWTLFSIGELDLALCQPAYQGALLNLSSTPVLSGFILPPGTYNFWFAVDYPRDGILDLNGTFQYDKVTVFVE